MAAERPSSVQHANGAPDPVSVRSGPPLANMGVAASPGERTSTERSPGITPVKVRKARQRKRIVAAPGGQWIRAHRSRDLRSAATSRNHGVVGLGPFSERR